jgi:hypothetical protein
VGQRASISSGIKILAQGGTVLIGSGMLVLLNTKGELIDQAPITECAVERAITKDAKVTIRDRHYRLTIESHYGKLFDGDATIAASMVGGLVGSPILMATGIKSETAFLRATKQFVEAFNAIAGRRM